MGPGKRLLAKYNSWKLGRKLLVAFALVSIIPILFVQIVAFQINKNQMTEKIDELMVSNLTQIAERVNLNLKIYTNLIYQIYKDEQVIDNILALEDDQDSRKAVAYNQVVNRLKQYHNSEAGIRCLSIVCPDGGAVVYDFETDSSLNTVWQDYSDLRQTPPYLESADAPGMVVTDTMNFNGKEKGHFYHISKRMFDFDHLERGCIATVIMTIEERSLNAICSNGDMDEYSINFIINEERRVVSYPDEDFAGIVMNPELEIEDFVRVSGYLRNRDMTINRYEDPITGWIFCNAYDKDYMLKDVTRTQQALVLITVLTLLFATSLIIYTVRTMDASVRSVVSGMQQVQKGNLDVVVPVRSFDEIGTIADNFNDMTVKVKELIEEVGEAKEQQKNAEIRALEAQINPHFLYNTLDSINWMAIEKGEFEISKMLRDLGVILRYSVNKSNQMVSIWEAADWLEKYISLHQMRFNNAFSCEINVEERIRGGKIYKLLLQPFVENSILHGFRDIESGGLLRIDMSSAEDGGGITIIIEDNGKGMPPHLLKNYNDKEKAIADDGRGIGLHNAFARMHMYYGDEASWNVSSICGMGTVVTLRLPLRKGEEP
ncbi:HAMP domain protein [Marvinbryantia formatexigens DSM 14469]|uniref:histidine kinase n=1 Tax=Marvinbryantia formatexigens DSM 14469 TaxID=478749 RepID=C6LGW6_9FIRM|nr:histidine kinase [Marvinbryantia formatexigens]EET60025.1 HAMP domain protein [Marvinbryantia formatexigens DSM 14469]UWO23826.1 histidine kinase [Marvinbryantia formatexigens DSM 14469]SDF72595.1 two-component system, sensor histidine kinase YesM [Marvinbryantia formatexigens]